MQIKIIEGHNSSSYFSIRPVHVEIKEAIEWEDVAEGEEEISIEEGDVECFLSYFFKKYYDPKLLYNYNRDLEFGDVEEANQFEWYLEHNFYTYDTMNKMLDDIDKTVYLLKNNYDDILLDEVKRNYSIFYMVDRDSLDYINKDTSSVAIKRNIGVVIDFYESFVKRIRLMKENNPSYDLLSIMGP